MQDDRKKKTKGKQRWFRTVAGWDVEFLEICLKHINGSKQARSVLILKHTCNHFH